MEKNPMKGKRLTQEQKNDIVASKGNMSAKELADKYGVAETTIYNNWKKGGKKKVRGVKKSATAIAKVISKSVAAGSPNPNQNRIDFCKRWIAILQEEVNRLESETDLLKEAEAVLSKIIPNQQ